MNHNSAKLAFYLFMSAVAVSVAPVAGQDVGDKRPTRIWNLIGPLGETPKHGTDAYPLSDQGFEHKYNMNLHVFHTPQEKKHWSVGGVWEAPWRFADDYHVFGLDWREHEIRYYVDGVLVFSVENTHWHQPLFLIFDSETMPGWLGMPDDKDLPSTFSVEYLRAWKVK